MPHPEMELRSDHEKSMRSAMQPVYPSTEKLSNSGITNRVINGLMQQLFLEAKNELRRKASQNPFWTALKLLPKK